MSPAESRGASRQRVKHVKLVTQGVNRELSIAVDTFVIAAFGSNNEAVSIGVDGLGESWYGTALGF